MRQIFLKTAIFTIMVIAFGKIAVLPAAYSQEATVTKIVFHVA